MAINTSQGAGTVITEYDQWRFAASASVSSGDVITNWKRQDYQGNYIGSGMSVSSGTWTFPRTGIYHIHHQAAGYVNANIQYFSMTMDITTNNGSNWYNLSSTWQGSNYNISNPHFMQSGHAVIDVTNTSVVKVRFRIDVPQTITLFGGSQSNHTCATFMRVGDT